MPGTLETALSPEEVRAFCERLAATPGGTSLRVIIEEAQKHGVTLTTTSAATVRDGPLAVVLAELKATAESAEAVTALARDGREIADATTALLVHRLFLKLQTAGELEPRELEQVSLVQARLQTGIHRTRRLEAERDALQQKLALREKELALAREKFDEQVKDDVEKGLVALAAEVRSNPEALEIYYKFSDCLKKAREGRAA